MMRYSEENERLADQSACAGVRADLKMCLLESDCCKIHRKTPRECLRSNDVPTECLALRNTFFECKRSMLDNRQRFRGRKGY
ncbi:cytochrome c oxidase assembly factor 5 [Tribolium castaneum]|uniref:Cytochrome c oxidase assembly factor 5 n=1 Tax=Tribolium castaneum TaxID=7070 RepID=A0A139WN12_TRICA|nr:PREDICTED: cytochrome c oxidase assembly factor 5 [Tribolium castaneum]KYB29380.1 Cytochrome c oxidase assembly factor 5-like Protein [Tribolium castaneum]|eukprot:XP_008190271.1 PREDICTED: cytochrome c oxidase assembly factor 5 [Tribolium castaneum]